MAFADTAKLVVDLSLTGNFKRELASSQGALNTFNSRVTGGLSKVSTAAEKTRGALSRAGTQVKNLVTGPVGMIGLTGVALGLVGAMSAAVRKADEFGQAILKVSAVTGDTVEETSKLVDTLDFFGVNADDQVRVIGMAEKNLGELTSTTKKAVEFQKRYGLGLTDANGKQLKFNDLLLTASDYFNDKHIPAATKAAGLAKVFGRNWQQLIPVLSAGSDKLREMEGDAIKLTAADIENMKQFKDASREWDDAIGDLQVTLGAKLLPELSGLARTASAFVRDHSADIVAFFKNAYQAAAKLAGIVGDVGRGLLGVWNAIPEPMRDLLVKGLIADRTVKFLFGFSPIKFATDTIGSALVKGLSTLIGKNIVQPVFVTNQIPGLPGAGVPGGGGGGILATAGKLIVPVTIAAIAVEAAGALANAIDPTAVGPGKGTFANRDPRRFDQFGRVIANSAAEFNAKVKSGASSVKDTFDRIKPGAEGGTNRASDATLLDTFDRRKIVQPLSDSFDRAVVPATKAVDELRGKVADDLATVNNSTRQVSGDVSRAGSLIYSGTYGAASGIISAIYAARPIVNTNVNVSATTVKQTQEVTVRYGRTSGDALANSGYLGGAR